MAIGLKFQIYGLYYPCYENKDYREADLCLCFRICGSYNTAHIDTVIVIEIVDRSQSLESLSIRKEVVYYSDVCYIITTKHMKSLIGSTWPNGPISHFKLMHYMK